MYCKFGLMNMCTDPNNISCHTDIFNILKSVPSEINHIFGHLNLAAWSWIMKFTAKLENQVMFVGCFAK